MWLRGLLAVAAFSAAPAFADTTGTKEEQAACKPDVRRFCGHIAGANQKYHDCLQSHFSDLSQKCQQVLVMHQNQQ